MEATQDILGFLNNYSKKYQASNPRLSILPVKEQDISDIRLFHIQELPTQTSVTRVTEQKNLLNILGQEDTLVLYLIHSTAEGFEYYYGVLPDAGNTTDCRDNSKKADQSEELLKHALNTYYTNATYNKVEEEQKSKILTELQYQKYTGVIEGVPALYQESGLDNELNRLVQTLSGKEFYLCVLAKPVSTQMLCELEHCLQEVTNEVSALANQTMTISKSTNCTNNRSSVASTTMSNSNTRLRSRNFQSNIFLEYPDDESEADTISEENAINDEDTANDETAIDEDEVLEDIALNDSENPEDMESGTGEDDLEDILEQENAVDEQQEQDLEQQQEQEDREPESDMQRNRSARRTWKQKIDAAAGSKTQKAVTDAANGAAKKLTNNPQTFRVRPGQPFPSDDEIQFRNYTVNRGISCNDICLKSIGGSKTNSCIDTSIRTVSRVQTISNQNAISWLNYIKTYLQDRIDAAKGNALFLSQYMVLSDSYETYQMAAMKSVSNSTTQQANQVPLKAFLLDCDSELKCALQHLNIPIVCYPVNQNQILQKKEWLRAAFAQVIKCNTGYFGNWYSSRELAVKTALPTVNVTGFLNREASAFAVTVPEADEDVIRYGSLEFQGGNEIPPELTIPYSSLYGINYIFGDTIGGTVRTVNEFLLYSDVVSLFLNFYGVDLGLGEIVAFDQKEKSVVTVDPLTIGINMFQLYEGDKINERIDYIMECIKLAFPLDESSLYRFQTAAYECYEEYGWNLSTNEYELQQDPYSGEIDAFPILSDVINKIEADLNEQSIGPRLLNDYLSRIKIHLGGMIIGAKANFFNAKRTIDFEDLTNKNVMLDFTVFKNQNERVFAYSILMLELMKYRQRTQSDQTKVKHVIISDGIEHLYGNTSKENELRQHTQIWKEVFETAAKHKEGVIALSRHTRYFPQEMLEAANMIFCNRLANQEETEPLILAGRMNQKQAGFLRKLKDHQLIATCKDRCYLVNAKQNEPK